MGSFGSRHTSSRPTATASHVLAIAPVVRIGEEPSLAMAGGACCAASP
jgi:hypothetical protein